MARNSTGATRRLTSGRSIGPFGTVARLGVGAALLVLAFAGVLHDGVAWYEGLAGFVGLPVGIVVVQVMAARVVGRRFEATDGLAFWTNFAVGAVLFGVDSTRDIAALFFGSSLILAAARGYAGCEVLAVSNFVLRRQDQVGCVLFSPIDELEARVTDRAASRA
jgi:hypothetical protein